ncbi:MAG: hypothetical protein JHC33_03360 [Ignisphaera sp.]|nr:hypothetical protein [Ignisphaera sp.]
MYKILFSAALLIAVAGTITEYTMDMFANAKKETLRVATEVNTEMKSQLLVLGDTSTVAENETLTNQAVAQAEALQDPGMIDINSVVAQMDATKDYTAEITNDTATIN